MYYYPEDRKREKVLIYTSVGCSVLSVLFGITILVFIALFVTADQDCIIGNDPLHRRLVVIVDPKIPEIPSFQVYKSIELPSHKGYGYTDALRNTKEIEITPPSKPHRKVLQIVPNTTVGEVTKTRSITVLKECMYRYQKTMDYGYCFTELEANVDKINLRVVWWCDAFELRFLMNKAFT